MMKFSEMNLSDRTIAALDELGYLTPTEVQEKSILPIIEGKEVVVRSQTGTGKTAAFGIGLMEMISKDKKSKALILAPTRELALQITKELRSIGEHHGFRIYAVYGGTGMGSQIELLRRGFDVIVATPGRLLDHAERGTVNLAAVNHVVLDEADTMLDMGFKEDIDKILERTSPQKQMMLFSATIDGRIRSLANSYMNQPMFIEAGPQGNLETIEEEMVHLSRAEKLAKLKEFLSQEPVSRAIVFVATKHGTERICHQLNVAGLDAECLHGNKSQNQRERVMRDFKEGQFRVLVATDVAARGLHVEEISHIINYDEAQTRETHTHRIGRTGRMGKSGKAITFVETDPLPKIDYRTKRAGARGGRGGGYGGGYLRQGPGGRGGPSRSGDRGYSPSGERRPAYGGIPREEGHSPRREGAGFGGARNRYDFRDSGTGHREGGSRREGGEHPHGRDRSHARPKRRRY